MGRSLDEHSRDVQVGLRRSNETFVSRYQRCPQPIREGNVGRVVGGEVGAKPEYPREEILMTMPNQREIEVIPQRLLGPFL